MRTLTALVSIIFIYNFSFAQSKNLYGVTSPNGDTSLWYRFHAESLRKLSLPSLDTSNCEEYYRLYTSSIVIDIWQDQNDLTSGKVTIWTDEAIPASEKPTNRTYIETKKLTSDTAQRIRQLFLSSGILPLPTDDSIKGWQQGFDGINYFVEHSTKKTYAFKSYWTPRAQDSLAEALLVEAFVDSAFSLINGKSIVDSFTLSIPFECSTNGMSVRCRVLTKKQRKKYIREREMYRRKKS